MVKINVQQEKIEFPDHIEPQRVVKTKKLGTEWRVKWPILYDRHKNVNTINLFSFYWPGSELCHANNQQNIHQPAQSDSREHNARACALQLNKCVRAVRGTFFSPSPATEMITPDHTQPSLLILSQIWKSCSWNLSGKWPFSVDTKYPFPHTTGLSHHNLFQGHNITSRWIEILGSCILVIRAFTE